MENKTKEIREDEIKILKDIGTINKDIEKELESLMNSDNDHGAQITSSDQPEDDADTFSDEEDSDDRISEADDENSQDGITENENLTDTDLSMSENVPGIDSSNMRIKDEPMEEEFKKTNPKHIKRIGHICRLCGFKAATKNPVRQLEDHLAQKHFSDNLVKDLPQTPPFYCPKSECKARGKMFLTMQFLRQHIGNKHGILQRYIRDEGSW